MYFFLDQNQAQLQCFFPGKTLSMQIQTILLLSSQKTQPKIVLLILLTNILKKVNIHLTLLPIFAELHTSESISSGSIYFILQVFR